ncbi:GNAT family N-acetyltransferase [Sabulicella rubraurantiaca]|uniref:GNAT family N-acetyltransferase n=1 Tax=Sabulicella rubraurantiaca TaxID=2811429 RepID=UPI001A95983D|nr:GNAT family N-acetyltransferase [Sabulicella rubraurantiaca]
MTSRHGLEIRTATPGDAAGLAELLESAGDAIPERDLTERLGVLRQAAGTVLIAVQWGPPSGLVVLHWYPTLGDARPTAQVTTLLVGVEERRRGIGRLLIKAASQAARSAGCGNLEVLAGLEEPSLREFCLATGFSEARGRFTRSLRKQG